VGSPPTLAQRVLNETLWHPAFFCCCGIEATQGFEVEVEFKSGQNIDRHPFK
jgi:hypothetical protein